MSESGRLIVTEWRYEPPADCDRKRSRVSEKSYSAWIGAAGSLLLHALFFLSVLFGAQVMKVRRPEVQGVGAARIPSREAPSETLILLNKVSRRKGSSKQSRNRAWRRGTQTSLISSIRRRWPSRINTASMYRSCYLSRHGSRGMAVAICTRTRTTPLAQRLAALVRRD